MLNSLTLSLSLSLSQGTSSKSHDMHDQIKQLDGCRAIKVRIVHEAGFLASQSQDVCFLIPTG